MTKEKREGGSQLAARAYLICIYWCIYWGTGFAHLFRFNYAIAAKGINGCNSANAQTDKNTTISRYHVGVFRF